MVTTAPSTIFLDPPVRTVEALANAALSPGHLIELMSTGLFRKQTKAAQIVPRRVAFEKEYDGTGISTAYSANDTVVVGVFRPGDRALLRLAAAATAVVIGDKLESAGDGTVRKSIGSLIDNSGGVADGTIAAVTGSYVEATMENNTADLAAAINANTAIAIALEAVDNSAGGSEAFIRVEFI